MNKQNILKIFITNTKKLFNKKASLFVFFFGLMLIGIPSYYFTNSTLIIGNLGYVYYYLEVSLGIIISLLFGLFLSASFYKIEYFSTKKTGVGLFGAFIGILVSGCPACSITLASYIGLTGIVSIFPYGGIELKIFSVLLLIYASYSTIINLETCKIKK